MQEEGGSQEALEPESLQKGDADLGIICGSAPHDEVREQVTRSTRPGRRATDEAGAGSEAE